MEIIHINDSHDTNKLATVRKYVEEGKDVYVLVYMVGCGACDIVHPEWNKIKEELGKQNADDLLNNSNIVVVDLNKDFLDHSDNTFIKDETIVGYPTLLFIGKGKKDELKSSLPDVATIVGWIKKNSLGEKQRGGKKTRKLFHKRGKITKRRQSARKTKTKSKSKSKSKRGGKWSLRYKKSIDCRHPRGFSQRQHCKYGRKNWK